MTEQLQNTRVVVTGSAGVIGRELIAQLGRRGAHVLSIDREPLPETANASVEHLQVDLATGGRREIEAFDPQIILHLAASFERAVETADFWPVNWNDNTLASHNVVEAARNASALKTFVFASSYLIYDPDLYLRATPDGAAARLSESDRTSTRNLCGAAKYYTEQELAFLSEIARPGVRTPSARIFRVYGRGSRDVISRWVRTLLAGGSIDVYNARNRFDYIFSRDVAEGLLRIALAPAAGNGPVNLGSGRARSIDDVLGVLAKHFPDLGERMTRHGDTERFEASSADLTRLQKTLGWTPGRQIEEGIAELVEYERAAADVQAVNA